MQKMPIACRPKLKACPDSLAMPLGNVITLEQAMGQSRRCGQRQGHEKFGSSRRSSSFGLSASGRILGEPFTNLISFRFPFVANALIQKRFEQ